MSATRSALFCRLGAVCLLLITFCPAPALAWSGLQHIQVNKAAGRHLPDEMAGFRAFSRPMALPAVYPDLWKEYDPAESPRHYFEPDRLPPGVDLLSLPRSQAEALARIQLRPDEIGVAPWTIVDLLDQMTSAMRTNDWLWAARCGAALSHYVADLHMPLHCTRNFNGQETWQSGIHERLEIDLVKAFFRPEMIAPGPAVAIADPFREILGWIDHSAALARDVLKADLIAKRTANGRIDTESYYLKLWELTGDMVIQQLEDAATHLASLWYTAWINAGRPPIPEPFDELPTTSVFSDVGIEPPTEGGPVGARAREDRTYNVIIWSVMGIIGLIVIASSIHRGIQSRRARPP